jgi:hypothetical protein
VRDGKDLRRLALALKVPIITTVAGAVATANALKGLRNKPLQHVRTVKSFAVTLPAAKHMCAHVVTINLAWDRAHHWSVSPSVNNLTGCRCLCLRRYRCRSTSLTTSMPRRHCQRRSRLQKRRLRWRLHHEALAAHARLLLAVNCCRMSCTRGI